MKQCPDLIFGETKKERIQLSHLRDNLHRLSQQIEMDRAVEKRIGLALLETQKRQASFGERLSKASHTLQHLKSLLASFHS